MILAHATRLADISMARNRCEIIEESSRNHRGMIADERSRWQRFFFFAFIPALESVIKEQR